MGPSSPPQKGGGAPLIFRACLSWPNGWMVQDGTWHGGGPRSRPHCIRCAWTQLPSPTPKFSAHVYSGQTAGWIKMALGMKVGLGPGQIVLMGTQLPSPKKGAEPPQQFSSHFYCGQTAGCIKMPLGMEVGPSPEDFGLDGDPAHPLPKERRRLGAKPHPQVSAHGYCGRAAGWIRMALGTEVSLGPIHIVLDGDIAPLPKKGAEAPPNFRPNFIVAKRLDASRCHLVWR